MKPCDLCGDFCGGSCVVKAQSMKDVLFPMLYGGGMGVVKKPLSVGPLDEYPNPVVSPLVAGALEEYAAADLEATKALYEGKHAAPEEFAPTQKVSLKGLFDKYMPLDEASQPKYTFATEGLAKGGPIKGSAGTHDAPGVMDVETSGTPWSNPNHDVVGDMKKFIAASKVSYLSSGQSKTEAELLKALKDPYVEKQATKGETMKYDHALYATQVTNFASFHGIPRHAAWEKTLGAISEANGYGWKNPYKASGKIPGCSEKAYWPNLLSGWLKCNCETCKQQFLAATTSAKKPKQSNSPFFDGNGTVPEHPVILDFEKIEKPENAESKVDEALAAKIGLGLNGMSPAQAVKLVRMGYKGHPATGEPTEGSAAHYLKHMPKWVLKAVAMTPVSEPDARAFMLKDTATYLWQNQDPFAGIPGLGGVKVVAGQQIKAGSLLIGDDGLANQIASVQNLVPTSMTMATKMSPETFAVMTGLKTETLKPGDQVIITVSKDGTLVIPDGMNAMVVRK